METVHEGKRKFECEICGNGFIYLSHLKTHRLSHTGEKPFVCDMCPTTAEGPTVAYTRIESLRSHMKSTHQTFLGLPCDICGKIFQLIRDLKNHKATHIPAEGYTDFASMP